MEIIAFDRHKHYTLASVEDVEGLHQALSEQIGVSLRVWSLTSGDAQSLPLFQQLAGRDPPRGGGVNPLSAVPATGRGSPDRAGRRYLP